MQTVLNLGHDSNFRFYISLECSLKYYLIYFKSLFNLAPLTYLHYSTLPHYSNLLGLSVFLPLQLWLYFHVFEYLCDVVNCVLSFAHLFNPINIGKCLPIIIDIYNVDVNEWWRWRKKINGVERHDFEVHD